MKKLPFDHREIIESSIAVDNDYGITYELVDGCVVSCPVEGGVWLDDRQVSGTCDKPYRQIREAVELYI